MILHVDMDAFYASVEQRDRPELRGRPVIVGGTPQGRGVVAAASYEARRFGVHSAMPAITARRLCPQAVFLKTRIDHYAAVSRQIREIFGRFTPLVEPLSLDEAFLDVVGSRRLFGPAAEIGRQIKSIVHQELKLVASVGVAPNKFLAKLASDLEKPDGFVVVESGQIEPFLDPLPVTRLWGVGTAAARVLQRMGIERIGQLRRLPADVLTQSFGRSGAHLWRLARGIDHRRVVPDHAAKSISHETTFAVDVTDVDVLDAWLMELTEQVARRLRRHSMRARTVQLKIRYGDFRTYTRAKTLPEATDSTDAVWRTASELLATRLPDRSLSVRLLGVGVTGIERPGPRQQRLFETDDQSRSRKLDDVTDRIRDRFGSQAVGRATRLQSLEFRKPPDTVEGDAARPEA